MRAKAELDAAETLLAAKEKELAVVQAEFDTAMAQRQASTI